MYENIAYIRHDRSVKDFPTLALDDDEYVEFAFKRAKIYLVLMYSGLILGLALVAIALSIATSKTSMLGPMGQNFINIILMILIVAALIAAGFIWMIYHGNKVFITNKRVIQKVRLSPFATSTNMVDLSSIEDVSYRQGGILQTLFHYGTFRLATVGDETTYTFPYAEVSADDLKVISRMISDAKDNKD